MAGRRLIRRLAAAALALVMAAGPAHAADPPVPPRAGDAVRVAQFNAAMARKGAGVLIRDIARGDPQVLAVAEIILRVRPDILLINELDADPEGRALAGFRNLLAEGVAGLDGLDYAHAHQGPQNVGIPSGHDLDGDGRSMGPGDAFGFGRFPGQYAMAVLSRFPLGAVRSFARLRWAAMPGARRPVKPDGTPFHADAAWQAMRLSSKAHWIVPVAIEGGTLHLLAAHPTPPVFDGPEDRNGRRNADEIRLIREILGAGGDWLADDTGRPGGLGPADLVVVAGDLNADPDGGDGIRAEIAALLADPRLQDPAPASPGAPGGQTADWPDAPGGPISLRVDYVLPSTGFEVLGAGVFWPGRGDPLARLTGLRKRRPASSDHRLVWVDLRPR
ncbi:endonuclease/exonuclease/phosphatase family protein [Paralimibaculum aggregatum]|uniref:Endonuclease/exonuclease/phosphatase family protein n=1 Tax=Paralimibaculum aggregatum TaxID=3036245 RepID=A0ABQ6LQ68_9RHOB|nr:endonuclease/exonuclease/phosphatase family protein [Limibaculum sp. NKW23]GMG82964.1 endonuclease/exonuclease/phosphatase family protein [Limibaculum sp. NKW23]